MAGIEEAQDVRGLVLNECGRVDLRPPPRVAASAPVGATGREGDLIRKALIPMTCYVCAAGNLGIAMIVAGGNMWFPAWLAVVMCFIAFMYTSRGKRESRTAPQEDFGDESVS